MIEPVLPRHPDVPMAAAVIEPDACAGELPVALVSLKPGGQTSPEALPSFAAPLIAERSAGSRRVQVIPSVPMTAVGKDHRPLQGAGRLRHTFAP